MLDNIPYLPYFISAFIGIGLAAASGFRVFLPMFAVSLASYMGWIPMNENFQWFWFTYAYHYRNCHCGRNFSILHSVR